MVFRPALLGPLHRRQAARVFARQGFGTGPEQRDEDVHGLGHRGGALADGAMDTEQHGIDVVLVQVAGDSDISYYAWWREEAPIKFGETSGTTRACHQLSQM
jgi:hypothetical protein